MIKIRKMSKLKTIQKAVSENGISKVGVSIGFAENAFGAINIAINSNKVLPFSPLFCSYLLFPRPSLFHTGGEGNGKPANGGVYTFKSKYAHVPRNDSRREVVWLLEYPDAHAAPGRMILKQRNFHDSD